MKYTILLTQECNLRCKYCYIVKKESSLDLYTSEKIIEFIFNNTPPDEKIDIGFFGGEPLLEFEKLKHIVNIVECRNDFKTRKVEIQVVSNGTIFSDEIADFLNNHGIIFGLSCDGIPEVQNANRIFKDGTGSSVIVEKNIRKSLEAFPALMVNAVYTPGTYKFLPDSIKYLYSLGLRKIYVNADYSSHWTNIDSELIGHYYDKLADIYIDWYKNDDPAFLSPVNGKIAVMLEQGYKPEDKCHMGVKEFAFAPNGNIYPCERLLGDGEENPHCIGNVNNPEKIKDPGCSRHCLQTAQLECTKCSLRNYCMNWCGCSNYFATGFYNRAGHFICASEKAAINAGYKAFNYLEQKFGASVIDKILGDGCPDNREPAIKDVQINQ